MGTDILYFQNLFVLSLCNSNCRRFDANNFDLTSLLVIKIIFFIGITKLNMKVTYLKTQEIF